MDLVKIRRDFQILEGKKGPGITYLDNACQTGCGRQWFSTK